MAIENALNNENSIRKTVMALIARAVFGASLKLPQGIDWLAVFKEYRSQAVDGRSGECLAVDV